MNVHLYQVFWQRTPDQSGWNYWTAQVASQGRATVLTSFANSTAFAEVAGTLYRETLWLIPDHLGTTRMIAERTGLLSGMKRHDYLPFGEEIQAGILGRTNAQGYILDNVRQGFTGYERDDETGLDYAHARYYSSQLGRFSSTDPLMASGRSAMPQSWNRYAYVLNNPLLFIDPTGLREEGGNPTEHPDKMVGIAGITDTAILAIRTEEQPFNPETDTRKVGNIDAEGNITFEEARLVRFQFTFTVTDEAGKELSNYSAQPSFYNEDTGDAQPMLDPPVRVVGSDYTEISTEPYNVVINVGGEKTSVDFTAEINGNSVRVRNDYNDRVKTPLTVHLKVMPVRGSYP